VIGKGSYAKVLLVRYKKDEQVYAMKVLKKKHISDLKLQEKIMTERKVLASLNHPFLVRLYFSFQDEKKLYFVLEYCPGGELYGLLQVKNKLSEEQCKFYAAQILLALEALHNQKIVYRE
jgi:serine/threonine protein kinase